MKLVQGLGVALLLVSCAEDSDGPLPARCGDGLLHPSETSDTCCVDAGCPRGVCDTATMACVQPWSFTCPTQTDSCADEQPYLCDDDPPSYDCAECGCPEGHTCFESVCFADEMPALEHTGSYNPPDDLPLDEYFTLIDWAGSWAGSAQAMTYAALIGELDTLLREDGRRMALLLGESHGSPDEQATGMQIMKDMLARGWLIPELGIEWHGTPILEEETYGVLGLETDFIEGDLTNVAYCAAATGQPNDTNAGGLYVQYSGSGHTSQEICRHHYHWAICDLPHTSECLARVGRKALTVILFDPNVWLTTTDRILLWRVGDQYPNAANATASLEASIASWDGHMATQLTESQYDATLNGRDLTVRVLPSLYTDEVYFAYFPRPGRPAFLMRSFQAVWNDATLQEFLLAHDIQPGNCSISWNLTPGAETFSLFCGNDGYELDATVDGLDFVLVSSTMRTP